MAETGLLLTILGLTVAMPGIGASSLGPWFCYRLVPAPITSAITPCMFPCLFISPHEHPHIVVHNEADGTPCKVTSGLQHETKDGRCSSGVCTVNRGPPVLKRKKRFICLFTLAQLLKAKRERRLLKSELEALKRQAWLNHHRRVSYAGGSVSRSNLNRLRGEGSRGSSGSSSDPNVVEIHLVVPGAVGIGANNPGIRSSGSVNFRNSVGGNVRSGVAGHPGFVNLGVERINGGPNDFNNEERGGAVGGNIIPGNTDISVTTGSDSSDVGGDGPGTSGARVVANIGMGHNGAGDALGGNSVATVVTTSAGTAGSSGGRLGGHSGMDLENRAGLGTSTSAMGGRSSAASVVGIAGVGMRNGIRGGVGPGSVRSGVGGAEVGNVVSIGGAVSTAATRGGNNVRLGATAVGASHVSVRRPNAAGIGGARSPFVTSGGRFRAGIVGRGRGIEVESDSSRGNGFFRPTGGTSDSFDSRGFWDDGFGSADDFAGDGGF